MIVNRGRVLLALAKIVRRLQDEVPCCACCGGDDGYRAILAQVEELADEASLLPWCVEAVSTLDGRRVIVDGPFARLKEARAQAAALRAIGLERAGFADGKGRIAVALDPSFFPS